MSLQSDIIDDLRERAQKAEAEVLALKTALASIAGQMGGTVTGCSVEMHCQVPKEVAAVLAKVRGVAQMYADFACTNGSWTEGARRAGHAVLAVLPGGGGMSEQLTVRESIYLSDWYVIETEDGRDVNEASVEGNLADMRELSAAIKGRASQSCGRRAGVIINGTRCAFYSPRNSGDSGLSWFDLANADALAGKIDGLKVQP